MRIYETLKEGEVERKVKYKGGNKGTEEDQSRHSSFGHLCYSHFSSSSSFVCLITGCILSPSLVYLKFMRFFLLSVICQKKSFLNHLQTHTLCVFPFLLHFLPCLSIIVAVKTLYISSLTYSVSLYLVHSLTLFTHSSFLSLLLSVYAKQIHAELSCASGLHIHE